VPSRPGVEDAVIIGAGLHGLAAAFALARERIMRVTILDTGGGDHGAALAALAAPPAPACLDLAGGSFVCPELSFGAWHAAVHGTAALPFGAGLAARWAAYLDWYRHVLDLPRPRQRRVRAVAPAGDLLRVTLDSGESLTAGHVVVADRWAELEPDAAETGAAGGGRIAVLGGGARAAELCLAALEGGAEAVDHYDAPVAARGLPDRHLFACLSGPACAEAVEALLVPPAAPAAWTAQLERHPHYRRLALPGWGARGAVAYDRVLHAPQPCRAWQRPAGLAPVVPALRESRLPPLRAGSFGMEPHEAGAAASRLHLFGSAAVGSLGPAAIGAGLLRFGLPLLADAISRAIFLAEADGLYGAFLGFETAEQRATAPPR